MVTKIRFLIGFLSLFLAASCFSDKEYIPVDFSQTVSVPKPQQKTDSEKQIRVAIAAMISPKETFVYYQDILQYLGRKINFEIQLVQRKTYQEVNELLLNNKIDLAFICSGPYALEKEKYEFDAIVTPIVRGNPFYQSYLIVHKDSQFFELEDLRNHSFAFSDPNSNSGSLVPNYWLHTMKERPESFFRSTNFTYSHDNSILTVAKSLVDGAAVDGHKWEYFQQKDNTYTSQTRIIKKSEKFGSPPLVASKFLSEKLKKSIQTILLSMHEEREGKEILENLLIDRFTKTEPKWYQPIQKMHKSLINTKS
ncbi:MAG: phosphate/phosphite/phosphonate ABC transporter substrate-binding protein [Deltaproteobacteria bacterium]|jgi:phosphonate transport system substrate-binding protein|nr:phosphate/phosphite/phosphonate ABC transporter substrate-binding protein [Deltaproteobacteria bacterium]MBT4092105.1 phosphate/phosphite/phosphonate ABC transporter substrate-binding protein [Deltaproteobacteria bacterium]MBT4266516.1 phosphate/phosphite/phosphonate ABC transporter substrate-binding protein [Deltaproteobacteria bacterium]MBT4642903.1 phosphate/phosphite/phosphonate ABC transporter substrate-binding protein [Deltaproteobacteria bacterium]MBT6499691.1 phosphate/phosphite/phos